MDFDLAAMARRAGARRSMDFRIIVPTKALEDDLARIYMKVVRAWAAVARDRILPAYSQALERRAARDGMVRDDAGPLGDLFRELGPEFERLLLTLTPELRDWTVLVERWHREKWIAAVYTATGVDLTTMLSASEVAATVEDLIAWNAALIKDVSDEAQSRIAKAVFVGYRDRAPTREIAKQINEGLGLSRKRALRVAADQTQKLSSALDVERAVQAGLSDFTWRHSGKLHPRLWHKARDGKSFKYTGDPEVKNDMPGQAPYCGCKAQAKLSLG